MSAGDIFPPEIIEAILRLLPVKSLGRFKSVSKTWNSLISNPQFIKSHLHGTRKLISLSDTRSLYSIDISKTLPYLDSYEIPATGKELSLGSPPIRWVEILGSCNGLVLAKDEHYTSFSVNPTTQELCKVPPSPFELTDEYEHVAVRYGFGYDSSTDDYKLVSISFFDPFIRRYPDRPTVKDTFVSVYSLRNNSWKKLPKSPYDHTTVNGDHGNTGALFSQGFHWFVSSSKIVAFNFASEEFDEISLQLPATFEKDDVWFYDLVEIVGKLGVYLANRHRYELWVMEEYGNGKSWARVCSLEFSDPFCIVCLGVGSNGDVVLLDDDEFVVYNINEGRRRNLRIMGGPNVLCVGGIHVESIESLKRFITTS